MTVYVDTSLLIAVVFNEAASENARTWLKRTTQQIIVSDLVRLEFAAVVSRALRTGRLSQREAARSLMSFDDLRRATLSSSHGRADFELAEELIRDFDAKLAAPDALHLATAKNAGVALATFDVRLSNAARRHGVEAAALR